MEPITLFYATNNKSKLHNMYYRLKDYPIKVLCPDDLNLHIDVEENGSTAIENAYKKAGAYYQALKIPTIAGDSGVQIAGIPEESQPGLFVRRVNGKVLSDEEMIEYYANLVSEADKDCYLHYYTGIALITGEGVYTSTLLEPLLKLVSVPNTNRVHRGNPLDVITVTNSGKYYNDLTDEERIAQDRAGEENFTRFILEHLMIQEDN